MQESFLQNKVFQMVVRLIVALSFILFTAYQVYLAIHIEQSRVGRLIGIGIYVLITVASILAIFHNERCWAVHAVLMVVGLLLLFVVKLINLPVIFNMLSLGDTPSVLDGVIYFLSQLGTLLLIFGYLLPRANLAKNTLLKRETVLMSVVIVLFVVCFVMDCVLLLKYHANIELSLKLTLASRALYLVGFAGTAFSFQFPEPQPVLEERKGNYIYSDDSEDEVDLVI